MINIKRILCPTDLSPYAGNAVRYALALARAHDAELILLHCTDGTDGDEELRLLEASLLEQSILPISLARAGACRCTGGRRWRGNNDAGQVENGLI